MSEQPCLSAAGIGKSLTAADGSTLLVNTGITLTVRPGEFVSIVGPSGAGKTTLLRTLGGLTSPDQGTITHRGEPVNGVPPWLSIVFQEYNKTLFPWLSVRKNVRLAIRDRPKSAAERPVASVLSHVGLSEFADRYPWELSGGMQQRAALARAIVAEPELLLMDEPFASVDALTRSSLEDMVLRLWAEAGFAVVLVTHDIGEAVYLSDRVLAMSRRPSTILSEVTVDLPRPRAQTVTRALPRFHELGAELLRLITGDEAPGDSAPGDSAPGDSAPPRGKLSGREAAR
ncbi:MAG TPA: ABC transporter ATP-binding protein [Trebonia sp.]|jgi:NitT/TauT family transport system ATP-binding protein